MVGTRPADDGLPPVDEILREVHRVTVHSRKLVDGALSGSYVAAFQGAGVEFEEVREYVDGDDPRRLDHAVSARMDRPFVRTYVDERELQVVFVLDGSASMIGGPGGYDLLGLAARVMGCIALSAIRHDDRVGLLTFRDGVEHWIPPRKGTQHVMRLVRECLALRPTGGTTGFLEGLRHLRQALRRQAVVILLSDFRMPDWDRELGLLARRHDVVAVRLAAAPTSWPDRGLVRLRDPETGRERRLDLGRPEVREALSREVAREIRDFENAARGAGADPLTLHAPRAFGEDPVGPPLARFFRVRAGRRSRA